MTEFITMPRLSDTMEEGTVIKWHKKVGEKIEEGDLLAEIETDKAIQEFESEFNGYLLHIGIPEGKSAKVDSLLAIIGENTNLDINSILSRYNNNNELKNLNSNNNELKNLNNNNNELKNLNNNNNELNYLNNNNNELNYLNNNNNELNYLNNNNNERIIVSPLAKMMAKKKLISLKEIKGSGENGRIIKRDIENYEMSKTRNNIKNYEFSNLTSHEVINSSIRKVIAKRLAESKVTAPHYYLMIEVDMQNTIKSRSIINKNLKEEEKISFNDLIIKAAALALMENPKINSSWKEDYIIYHCNINIGVAIAVEDGLLVPVITHADKKTLRQISLEVKEKSRKARSRKISQEEMEGSTFTISNLGMFGVESFTSIINQPNSCILSIGAILEKPIIKNGIVVPGNIMKISLACDHRVVDGAIGSIYLQSIKKYLEDPIIMII